jgi:hypothetical protein
VSELQCDAINLLFAKHGLPQIAVRWVDRTFDSPALSRKPSFRSMSSLLLCATRASGLMSPAVLILVGRESAALRVGLLRN